MIQLYTIKTMTERSRGQISDFYWVYPDFSRKATSIMHTPSSVPESRRTHESDFQRDFTYTSASSQRTQCHLRVTTFKTPNPFQRISTANSSSTASSPAHLFQPPTPFFHFVPCYPNHRDMTFSFSISRRQNVGPRLFRL